VDFGHGGYRHVGAGKVAVPRGNRRVAFGLVSTAIAPDDIVRTAADADANGRPPLLVLDTLTGFLDSHGLGQGAIEATPIGEGALERHLPAAPRRARDGAAPAPAPAAAT